MGRLDGQTCYITVYVDDQLIIAPTTALVTRIKAALSSHFHMSDLGEVHFLLGWSISRDGTRRTIHLHQRKYAQTVLNNSVSSSLTPLPHCVNGTSNSRLTCSRRQRRTFMK
jgi:hypothetical protein